MFSKSVSAAMVCLVLATVWSGTARVEAATILTSGSPYTNNLGSLDGNFTIISEEHRLLGDGSVTSFSYFAGTTNPLRPLLIEDTGSSVNVIGIGADFTPAATGYQANVPFTLATGTASFDTATGNKYYFAFSPVGGAALPVSYNANNETVEGHPLRFLAGQVTSTGALPALGGPLTGANGRHYLMTVNTTQDDVAQVVGSELVNRSTLDGAGWTFVDTDSVFTEPGQVESWFIFSDTTVTRSVTPLIFTVEGGQYVVKGVGEAKTFSTRGFFELDFDLASGTDLVEPGDIIGWTDSGGTGAVIPFNTFGGSVTFFNTGFNTLTAGQNLGAGTGSDTREYSIAFSVAPLVVIPEPATAVMGLLGVIGLGLRRRRAA